MADARKVQAGKRQSDHSDEGHGTQDDRHYRFALRHSHCQQVPAQTEDQRRADPPEPGSDPLHPRGGQQLLVGQIVPIVAAHSPEQVRYASGLVDLSAESGETRPFHDAGFDRRQFTRFRLASPVDLSGPY